VHPLSYRSPKTAVKESAIHGRGLFATTDIAAGEIVCVKGGHILNRATLHELQPALGPAEIQIADDLFICPVAGEEREGSMIFSNHSCNPNLGLRGQIVFVAMRDIAAGEELTHDWAMTDDSDEAMSCRCGATICRGTISGKDWRRPELQQRYAGYFSSYLAEKMKRRLVRLGLLLMLLPFSSSFAQEVTLEEVRVEAPAESLLDVPVTNELQKFVERLRLQESVVRATELQIANQSITTKLLNLTRYSPIPLGGSDSRVDTFFLQNYTRADLNPREDNPLFK
jgi:hypothetical protein